MEAQRQKIKSYCCPPDAGMDYICSMKTAGRGSGGNGPWPEVSRALKLLAAVPLSPVRQEPSEALRYLPCFQDRDSLLWLHLESPGSSKHHSQLGPQGFWFNWGGGCPVQPGCAP